MRVIVHIGCWWTGGRVRVAAGSWGSRRVRRWSRCHFGKTARKKNVNKRNRRRFKSQYLLECLPLGVMASLMSRESSFTSKRLSTVRNIADIGSLSCMGTTMSCQRRRLYIKLKENWINQKMLVEVAFFFFFFFLYLSREIFLRKINISIHGVAHQCEYGNEQSRRSVEWTAYHNPTIRNGKGARQYEFFYVWKDQSVSKNVLCIRSRYRHMVYQLADEL
jgi:hypothetical protein